MKGLIKRIIKEETEQNNNSYILYVDMGGVLFEKMGADDGGQGDDTSYIGGELWNGIKKYNPIILSARGTKNIEKNEKIKTNQVEEYLSPIPKIMFVGSGTDKKKYSNPNSILIDDSKTNIDSWKTNGGIGIQHNLNDVKLTLDKLKELYKH
jgi:hypothetical protein